MAWNFNQSSTGNSNSSTGYFQHPAPITDVGFLIKLQNHIRQLQHTPQHSQPIFSPQPDAATVTLPLLEDHSSPMDCNWEIQRPSNAWAPQPSGGDPSTPPYFTPLPSVEGQQQPRAQSLAMSDREVDTDECNGRAPNIDSQCCSHVSELKIPITNILPGLKLVMAKILSAISELGHKVVFAITKDNQTTLSAISTSQNDITSTMKELISTKQEKSNNILKMVEDMSQRQIMIENMQRNFREELNDSLDGFRLEIFNRSDTKEIASPALMDEIKKLWEEIHAQRGFNRLFTDDVESFMKRVDREISRPGRTLFP
ncbi:hypothetical protein B0O99DRAFT_611809 [Bisporella sp. PMI_857]|nr:hypothetical protein B0O99DRAFT_611809 [Bisporella sp. PMI_857]